MKEIKFLKAMRSIAIIAIAAIISLSMAGCSTVDNGSQNRITDAWAHFSSPAFGHEFVPYSETNLTVTTTWANNQCYVAEFDTELVKQEVKKFTDSGWRMVRNSSTDNEVSCILFNEGQGVFQFIIPATINGERRHSITTVMTRDFQRQTNSNDYTSGLLWLLN